MGDETLLTGHVARRPSPAARRPSPAARRPPLNVSVAGGWALRYLSGRLCPPV